MPSPTDPLPADHLADVGGEGVDLVLIDPPPMERGRARRYTVHVQPSLFGGADVVRAWGRVDAMHRPRRLVTHHDTEAAALAALHEVVTLRMRHGYQPSRHPMSEATSNAWPSD